MTQTVPPGIPIAPPPWSLTGDGIIWLFKFPRVFVERNGFMADWQRNTLRWTLGAVMLVDYANTDVGPYFELLFIPGVFTVAGARLFSISKIYVSTAASVWNGIENWGIPKEQAEFVRERHAGGSDTVRVALSGREFFSAHVAPVGPRLPVSSSIVPLRVAQRLRGQTLITQPVAHGHASLCRVRQLQVDGALFPDVSQLKPLAVVAVRNFKMTFPLASIGH